MNSYVQHLQQPPAQELCQREGVTYLGLFGSVARGEETATSDVDLLVNFDTTKTLFELADIQYDFESILGRKVDLVMQNSVKKQLQPFIDRDLVTVYAKS